MFPRAQGALIGIASVVLMSFGTAHAATGQYSIGGNLGVGFYSGGSFNNSLAASGYKKVSQGWEYGGSLRYGISDRVALDYEVLNMNGKGRTKTVTPEFQAESNGIATPVSLYYELSKNDSYSFGIFGGAGPMFKTSWSTKQGPMSAESRTKTALYAHAGFEGQWKLSKKFAVTSRALARIAKAKQLEETTDPATRFDVSMSGTAFSLGFRAFFGGEGY